MTKFVSKFVRDDNGATAIEYGLIAALVAVAAIVSLQTLGTSLDSIFTDVASKLSPASPPAP